MLYETVSGRFHLKGRLVGLYLKNNITLFDLVIDLDKTVDDGAFFHRLAELR
jgi:hypothetical protein